MQTALDRDIPQLAAMMRRMSEHLEDYLRGGPESERILAMIPGSPRWRLWSFHCVKNSESLINFCRPSWLHRIQTHPPQRRI
jgi:hypothetical protein